MFTYIHIYICIYIYIYIEREVMSSYMRSYLLLSKNSFIEFIHTFGKIA